MRHFTSYAEWITSRADLLFVFRDVGVELGRTGDGAGQDSFLCVFKTKQYRKLFRAIA